MTGAIFSRGFFRRMDRFSMTGDLGWHGLITFVPLAPG